MCVVCASVSILMKNLRFLIFICRSEYCRNVKLKYCLESDSPWAQDFREKLSKDYQHGGFKGKHHCQLPALWIM